MSSRELLTAVRDAEPLLPPSSSAPAVLPSSPSEVKESSFSFSVCRETIEVRTSETNCSSREVILSQTRKRFCRDLQQDSKSSRDVSSLFQQVGCGLVEMVLLSDLQRREDEHFNSG